MFVRSLKDGKLYNKYTVDPERKIRFCSECGRGMHAGETYTVHQIHHPETGKIAAITRCEQCFPVKEDRNQIDMLDTAVWVNTPLPTERQTTGSMRPLGWERKEPSSPSACYEPKQRETEPRMKQVLKRLGVVQ